MCVWCFVLFYSDILHLRARASSEWSFFVTGFETFSASKIDYLFFFVTAMFNSIVVGSNWS